uniref:Uncharacterized protein n=1 Tax=Manihot esculenta TaxID=3983 RepID=A0A2C9UKQ7_MANES
MCGKTSGFSHVQIPLSCLIRNCPIKLVQKICQSELLNAYRELDAWTSPPASTKWYQLEVMSFDIYTGVQEPVWPKLLSLIP